MWLLPYHNASIMYLTLLHVQTLYDGTVYPRDKDDYCNFIKTDYTHIKIKNFIISIKNLSFVFYKFNFSLKYLTKMLFKKFYM